MIIGREGVGGISVDVVGNGVELLEVVVVEGERGEKERGATGKEEGRSYCDKGLIIVIQPIGKFTKHETLEDERERERNEQHPSEFI